ncbi:AsnC family transcriptional regulator [Microbispora rosea subsp. aerata]|nr:AsnC family transcriptional regulator [Microbispora rosea]GGO03731.1 AsnC family transcriptional regulator [Microbispora rosea subsp. aerata]GIH54859.1 AsnC family transcriptional regulator [Microbispora rosea subsp. aerata]GLJ83667.1 AsnC family transcriptional regulator [Microbispora rosea subsp. aerata]
MTNTRIDAISSKIIEILRQDGRISYSALGRAVGLSEAATRQRVRTLLDASVLKFTCVVDLERLGFSRTATLGIRCKGDLEAALERIGAVDGVDRLALTTGSVDIVAWIFAESDEGLIRRVNEIRNVESVRHVEIFAHLGQVPRKRPLDDGGSDRRPSSAASRS